jgi:hypothetical protein
MSAVAMPLATRRSAWKRGLVILAALLAVLAATEAVLQLAVSPLTPRVFQDDASARVLRLAPGARVHAHMFGREIQVEVDTQGLRRTVAAAVATQPASAGAAVRTLHVVGDSQVFGWGVSDEETIPSQVQTALGSGWRVMNHGVPGYGPTQYRTVLGRVPVDEPVLLVLTEENDLWDSYDIARAGSYCGYMSDGSAARWNLPCALLGTRVLQTWLSWRAQSPVQPTPLGFSSTNTVAARVASSRLQRWIAAERALRSDRLTVTVVPWRGRVDSALRAAYFPPADAADRTELWPDDCGMRERFGAELGGASLYLPEDSHLSARGAALLAREAGLCLARRGVAPAGPGGGA